MINDICIIILSCIVSCLLDSPPGDVKLGAMVEEEEEEDSLHGGKTGGIGPDIDLGLDPFASTRADGFIGKLNEASGLPIPDVGVDLTKFNDETYKEHYVKGFRKWNPGYVSKEFNYFILISLFLVLSL